MTERRLKRPRDPAQLAKLIVDIATGEVEDRVEDGCDSHAAELGRKGGKARAATMTPERRTALPAGSINPNATDDMISGSG